MNRSHKQSIHDPWLQLSHINIFSRIFYANFEDLKCQNHNSVSFWWTIFIHISISINVKYLIPIHSFNLSVAAIHWDDLSFPYQKVNLENQFVVPYGHGPFSLFFIELSWELALIHVQSVYKIWALFMTCPEKVNIDIINDLKKLILTSENKLREIIYGVHTWEISLLNNQKVKRKVYKYVFSFFENYQYAYKQLPRYMKIFPPVSQIGKHRIDGWKHAINETNKDTSE